MKYSFYYNKEKILIESNEMFKKWYESGVINEHTKLYEEEEHREVKAGELAGLVYVLNNEDSNLNTNNNYNELSENQIKKKEKKPIKRYIAFGLSISIGIIFCLIKNLFEEKLRYAYGSIAYYYGYASIKALIYIAMLLVISKGIHIVIKTKRIINIFIVVNIVFILYFLGGISASCDLFAKEKQNEDNATEKIMSYSKKISDGEQIENEELESLTYGKYLGLVKYSQQYYLDIQNIKESLKQISQKVDVPYILDTKLYGDKQKMAEVCKDIDEFINCCDSYHKKCNDALEKYINCAEKVVIPEVYKRNIINGFKRPNIDVKLSDEEYFNSKKSVLYSSKEILKFLQSTEGKYTLQNGKILFDEQKDSDKYNELFDELNNNLDKLNKVLESHSKDSDNKLKM